MARFKSRSLRDSGLCSCAVGEMLHRGFYVLEGVRDAVPVASLSPREVGRLRDREVAYDIARGERQRRGFPQIKAPSVFTEMQKGVSQLHKGRETFFRLSFKGQLIGGRKEFAVADPVHEFKN